MVNYGGLNHFFSLEDPPGDCVDIVLLHIEHLGALLVNSLVGDHFLFLEELGEGLHQVFMNKKFYVSFLVDISILGPPPELFVGGGDPIDWWLGVNCEYFVFVEVDEGFKYLLGLWG